MWGTLRAFSVRVECLVRVAEPVAVLGPGVEPDAQPVELLGVQFLGKVEGVLSCAQMSGSIGSPNAESSSRRLAKLRKRGGRSAGFGGSTAALCVETTPEQLWVLERDLERSHPSHGDPHDRALVAPIGDPVRALEVRDQVLGDEVLELALLGVHVEGALCAVVSAHEDHLGDLAGCHQPVQSLTAPPG